MHRSFSSKECFLYINTHRLVSNFWGSPQQLKTNVKAVKKISSPDKLFLDNPNLMYALSSAPEIGTIRETFFYNQLSRVCKVNYPDRGDFLVEGRYLFEVGGPKKSFNRIKDVENSFLAIDGVEFGRGNKIPLWLFGFLY